MTDVLDFSQGEELKDKLISIGKILNFQGIKGELKVGYTQGREKQLESLNVFFYETSSGFQKLSKESLRFHKKIAVIKFKEINSIDETVELKDKILYTEKNKIINSLEENEYFINDLIGLTVYDDKENFIGEVEFIADQGSGSIIGIKNDKKHHLVPFIKEFVTEVDISKRKITIKPIPGLIE
ncbi:MAG: ribosome maturation factor RimM [Candidatus Gastranaerophilaceae bacterium]